MAGKELGEYAGECGRLAGQTDNTELCNPLLSVRLSDEARAAVEDWAKKQPDKPTLSEAIRRLIEHGLATD